MKKPRLLDLFCGAGGCTRGYQLAGFHVTGVDVKAQPRYCGDCFVCGDALAYLELHAHHYDAIHASPPCQAHVKGLRAVNRARTDRRCFDAHEDLIPAVRRLLIGARRPYVIENVEGSGLHFPVRLCGTAFGLPLRRHRLFESSILLMGKDCEHGRFTEPKYCTSFRPHKEGQLSTVVQVYGRPGRGATRHWPAAMGIDWMTSRELSQAIPPDYTHYLGRQLLRGLGHEGAA